VEIEKVRAELARAAAARDELEKRLTTTQVESQRAIAQARDEAARARAGQPDSAAEAELEKRLAAARTEAAERFMQARNEADRQITAAQADAARCRADLEKAMVKLSEPPPEPAPAAAPVCPPAAAVEPAAPHLVIPAAEIAQQLAASGHVSLYVPFDTGSAVVKPNALPSIEPIAAALRQDPKLKLLLVGHTDSQGDFGFNRQLSENRAKAIVDQLIAKHGIDRARLAYAGVADLSPIATNDTDAGRMRNRRVELVKR
jgi:outer membrane protein OmpA-like peptidoglycan-associated protein